MYIAPAGYPAGAFCLVPPVGSGMKKAPQESRGAFVVAVKLITTVQQEDVISLVLGPWPR